MGIERTIVREQESISTTLHARLYLANCPLIGVNTAMSAPSKIVVVTKFIEFDAIVEWMNHTITMNTLPDGCQRSKRQVTIIVDRLARLTPRARV